MDSANVKSIDAIERLKAAFLMFQDASADAVAQVQMETYRVVDWVENDRVKYWQQQVRRCWDKVGEARANLERCMMMKIGDHEPSCYEEKKEFEKAKRNLRYAEEMVEKCRVWSRTLRHEVTEYEARVGQLTGWLEAEHPKGAALLERILKSLEFYTTTQAPTGDASSVGVETSERESASRGEEESTTTESKPESDDQEESPAAEPAGSAAQDDDSKEGEASRRQTESDR